MFAAGDNRGVCFLKISVPFSAGIAPGFSPFVDRAQSFMTTTVAEEIRVKSIDPLAGSDWDEAVSAHPDATIFHSSAWAKVLSETYRHVPQYRSFSRGERVLALLPMMEVKSALTGARGVCLPFSDSAGSLFFEWVEIGEHLREMAVERGWKYFELRGDLPAGDSRPAFDNFYGHKIDLTKSPDELLASCDGSFRRSLRKAERGGLKIEIRSDLRAVAQFYRLHNQTRRRHGIPPQPFSFFRNIQRHILDAGLGYIIMASVKTRPIAASVFFHFGQNALFKFGASDSDHQELRANNLVMWAGIKETQSRGLSTLHLGRTDLEHAGLRRFKLSLGASEETLTYLRFDTQSSRWLTKNPHAPSKIPAAIFRGLPLTVNQLAGTLLYPHLH